MVKCHVSDWKDSFIAFHRLSSLSALIIGVIIFNILDKTSMEIFWKKLYLALLLVEMIRLHMRQNDADSTGSGSTTPEEPTNFHS
jgi:hypothetical protein